MLRKRGLSVHRNILGLGTAATTVLRVPDSARELAAGGLLSYAQVSQHERAVGDENMIKRHPPRMPKGTSRDPRRVTGLEQRTDGEAQLVHAIGFEQRAKQRRAAFAQYLPQPALRELAEHDGHVEPLFATDDDIGHTRERV